MTDQDPQIQAYHRELLGLKPCITFHDIEPDTLAAIREAAERPAVPAQIVPIRPLSPEIVAANAELQAYQDWVNEQVAQAMRRVRALEWTHRYRFQHDDWRWLQ